MTPANALQYALFLGIVTLLVKPAGGYMSRVFRGERTFLDGALRPLERLIHRLCGIEPEVEMTWTGYARAFLVFSLIGTLLLYAILRLQRFLPWSSLPLSTPITPDLAANTAVSFSTTTTWQAYGGETTMSYFSQIAGLAFQNFVAGAAGLAVGIAFIRGLTREQSETVGNFWVDVVRATLWLLLPLSLIGSTLLIASGVPMNFHSYIDATTLEGARQTIAQGPVAALEWIKNLGTNGGGFFNANGAHPYENPTPFTNLLSMLAIAVLPAALTNTFGRWTGRPRHGWAIYWAMAALFAIGLALGAWAEAAGTPQLQALGVGQNMEGKEVRFGVHGSVLGAVTTSNGATGSTNAMHDSLTPLGGAVALTNMLLGEIVFGGLGTGLYGMIFVVLLAVFVGGLMIGRTPEYLGKKLGAPEIKLVVLYMVVAPMAVLLPAALAVVTKAGLAGLTTNSGPHGLTEIVYAYASSFANNGQTFGGLSANSPFYNVSTTGAMIAGRFVLAILALALAGRFAAQGKRPFTAGTLPTDTVLFTSFVVAVALVVGALTYLPILSLGPLLEHFQMMR